MTRDRSGTVVTFYSYKGGTGRTMALANVAWILASQGARVLVVDWDIDSPGLHRYFLPFLDPDRVKRSRGVVELIREFEGASASVDAAERTPAWFRERADIRRYAFSIDWPGGFAEGATLDFLPPGRQNGDYEKFLSALDWDDFHRRLAGGRFFDALRADMKRHYDYTLIDSRTGYSDAAAICTIQMPDLLVDCFTLNNQGVDGAAATAARVREHKDRVRILPVPMRVEPFEKERLDAARANAQRAFQGFPAGMDVTERDTYWKSVEIPYVPYYAYEEMLATFGDAPGSTTTLLRAYENLTSAITDGAITAVRQMPEPERLRVKAQFLHQHLVDSVLLTYAESDQLWADWVQRTLGAVGVVVHDAVAGGVPEPGVPKHSLAIVSRSNVDSERQRTSVSPYANDESMAVYVDGSAPISRITSAKSVSIAGATEAVATERLLGLVGRGAAQAEVLNEPHRPRFPGSPPVVFNAPARNSRFTGREDDLRALRERLLRQTTVVLSSAAPVALQGLGGIGKTQVALEYAWRYGASYDVVWWIHSGQDEFVDAGLIDLAKEIHLPVLADSPEDARALVNALEAGEPYKHWLLIFDNADEPERIAEFLPRRGGHVILTSRSTSWGDDVEQIPVEVFERRESIGLLRTRVPTLSVEEADQVADLLGDLPIAVAAAGAWLAETATSVADYAEQIRIRGLAAIAGDQKSRAIEATWDLSLERLRQRSPGGHRLLQLCSVMAPEIALDLVYSNEMARALEPFDPDVRDRVARAQPVQDINRLALLKLDPRTGQILIHRLLQHVVRSRMSEEEQAEARLRVQLVLAKARPEGEVDHPDTWPGFRALWPHLDAADVVHSDDDSVRLLLIDRVRYLYIRSDWPRGIETGEEYVTVWTQRLAALDAELARSDEPDPQLKDQRDLLERQLLHLRFNIANIHRALGNFAQARAIDEEVLAKQEALLGPTHPHTLQTAGGLGADLRSLGQYQDALARDEKTHAALLEKFGEDNSRTLAAQNNLAVSYRLMGNYRRAYDLDQAVTRGRTNLLGASNPNTLASTDNMCRDLRDDGQYEQALSLLAELTRRYETSAERDSRAAYNTQANYAISLRSVGRNEEAGQILGRVVERLAKDLPLNPDTLACRLSQAVNLLATRQLDLAEAALSAVESHYRERLGPDHPHTLVCMNNHAMIARAAGRTSEALALAEEAAAGLTTVLGERHPYTLGAENNRAMCLAESGRLEEALAVFTRTAAALDDVLGSDHPDTLRCHANLELTQQKLDLPTTMSRDEIGNRLADRIGAGHEAVTALREGSYLRRVIDPHPF